MGWAGVCSACPLYPPLLPLLLPARKDCLVKCWEPPPPLILPLPVGKDRLVKYWDVDRAEMLLQLPGHHGEVWALAVSAYGDFVVTGSHDRSLRRWERTQEPFFVEEEREKR